MKKINFFKLQASGNDFVLLDNRKLKLGTGRLKSLSRDICRRKLGIGADGTLVIDKSKRADFKMRIINADGSEAEMCGNGARCAALWCKHSNGRSADFTFETIAGLIKAKIANNRVKVGLTDAFGMKLDMPLMVLGRRIRVNYINTGVPHVVVFVQGLDNINVEEIGRAIRFNKKFAPAGTNVNFVEIGAKKSIFIRTYERGVESETLACGTGSVASAIISGIKYSGSKDRIIMPVNTRGGEVLKISFDRSKDKVKNIFLEGTARLIFKGEFNI
ncbi:MAG: diaminopimelate epimerase [Candidatus Omnitrophica bacterium]|nr:diaminopimelate epimerase [Candidatus Omnitrophota bacterium]